MSAAAETKTLAELERAFARVCLQAEAPAADLSRLAGPASRFLVYREMVRSRLIQTAADGLPRTRALLGPEVFAAQVEAHLGAVGPRSRFLRDFVSEVVDARAERWVKPHSATDDSPHLYDLARFEAALWDVTTLEAPADLRVEAFDFEACPVPNPVLRTLVVDHRVDKCTVDNARAVPPKEPEPKMLVVFRRPGQAKVVTWVLDRFGTRLAERWLTGAETCAESAKAVLHECGIEPDAAFVEGMAGLLATLVEEQMILGSRERA